MCVDWARVKKMRLTIYVLMRLLVKQHIARLRESGRRDGLPSPERVGDQVPSHKIQITALLLVSGNNLNKRGSTMKSNGDASNSTFKR